MPGFTRSVVVSYASAGLVRTLLASHLIKWNAQSVSDAALLVMSELFNNAVQKVSIAETITVHANLKEDEGRLIVAVRDTAPGSPQRREPVSSLEELDECQETEIGGWGLPLIEALSERAWVANEPGGKWVCAELKIS